MVFVKVTSKKLSFYPSTKLILTITKPLGKEDMKLPTQSLEEDLFTNIMQIPLFLCVTDIIGMAYYDGNLY